MQQPEARRQFAEIVAGPDESVDLAQAALLIACEEYPGLDVDRYLRRMEDLAASVALRAVGGGRGAGLRALHEVLFEEEGFHGNADDYYDPRNSFLNDVLERRLGIPISLSIVAMEVGRRLGVHLTGIAFPGHFLLAAADRHTYLDPFHGGIEVDDATLLHRLGQLARQAGRPAPELTRVPPDFLTPAAPATILARVLRNLVRIYVERADDARGLAAVDLLLVLTPDGVNELRTRGLLYERLGCPAAAVADFRRYLELAPGAPDASAIELRAAKLADGAPTLH